jgi:hypothetical protein
MAGEELRAGSRVAGSVPKLTPERSSLDCQDHVQRGHDPEAHDPRTYSLGAARPRRPADRAGRPRNRGGFFCPAASPRIRERTG